MRYFKLLISIFALVGIIYLLSNPLGSLPAIGNLVNPFTGFWQNAESVDAEDVELNLADLTGSVEIVYDNRHVPHIYAENLEDLIFAQGYAIAKERLWQMDITTRSIEGTTSEILGIKTLEADKLARQRGLGRAALIAENSWKKSKKGYHLLERFCDGINFYIDQLSPAEYPLEFKLLGYEPQKWSTYRTSLFIKAMALTLNAYHLDVASSNALNILGEEKFYDLYPDRNKKQSPIIEKEDWPEASISYDEVAPFLIPEVLPSFERPAKEIFVGSNNFALGGTRTKSGNPILANDPHLKLTLPSIWIEMHLVCPGMNAYGVSLPGMPGVTLGFNENISWGQTNVGQDVLDIYKMEWVGKDRKQYILDGKAVDAEFVIEKFQVKGEGEFLDTVIYTHLGPVKKEDGVQTDYAQRWISSDEPLPSEIDVYLGINRASNFEEFKKAISSFTSPAQNFIFSSKTGDIAMVVTGKFPVKADQQGRFVQDGSISSSEWKDFIPFEELPQHLNPKRGFVASANQHSADESYPYYYNGGFEDYRGRYINRKLESLEGASRSDLMNLQLDGYSLKAEEALPLLLDNIDQEDLTEIEKEVLASLEDWNYIYTSNSMGASYFEEWWASFYEETFDEIYMLRDSTNVPYPESFRLIEMMEEEPEHWAFDHTETSDVEEFSDIVHRSFKKIGFDTLEMEAWSERRNTSIDHLTNIPAFSVNEITSPGQGSTPNAISRHNGPSWRMVVEMDDPVKGYGVYPGGQSGNPGSPNFDNFVEDWASGKYYELNNSSDPKGVDAVFTIKMNAEK